MLDNVENAVGRASGDNGTDEVERLEECECMGRA